MKYRLFTIFSLFIILFTFWSFDHPVKLTTSLIQYNSDDNNMTVECRVFIDDFQKVLTNQNFDASELSKQDIAEIEFYFEEFYRFTVNNRNLPLNYTSSKAYISNNVLSLKFFINNLTIKKGDAFLIENELLFTEFGPLQSNKMTLRIPPFVKESYHEATFQDARVSYQF